jgi:septum formation protein
LTKTPELILASKSPRRAALLTLAGFRFRVLSRPVTEDDLENVSPTEHVELLSKRKVYNIQNKVESGIIIGADTIVYYQDHILGKPADGEDAFQMLASLSGQTHQVFTGLTLLDVDGKGITDTVCTDVTFRTLSDQEIRDYVNTGGPLDKAGAYGIQERAACFVSELRGCYFNVVGFPLSRFYEMLMLLWDEKKIRKFFIR